MAKKRTRKKRSEKSNRASRILLLVTIAIVLIGAFYLFNLYLFIVTRFERPQWDIPSKLYSDTMVLYPGLGLATTDLFSKLGRLGYQLENSQDQIDHNGEYYAENDMVVIYLNDFSYPYHEFLGYRLEIKLRDGLIEAMKNLETGKEVLSEEIEPELIDEFFGEMREERELIALEDPPQYLLDAIISIEDKQFFEHRGVAVKGILRAMWENIKARRIVQGGSTLTQQLVKNFFLTEKRTLRRKIKEVIIAIMIETLYTKGQIMEAYLNEIYLGQKGSVAICGFGRASKYYFGKPVKDISLAESALLVGMIKGPNYYSPYNHLERATSRQRVVLNSMLDDGVITEVQYNEASAEIIRLRQYRPFTSLAPYFTDLVRRQLSEVYPPSVLTTQGIKIFTTLDTNLQKLARRTLTNGILELEKRHDLVRQENENKLQGVIIVVHPYTGYTKALMGGRDWAISQFNRAIQANRQPGSLFKPIVYLTAFEKAYYGRGLPITPATEITDEPFTIQYEGQIWSPENYTNEFRGKVRVREALEQSINIPTVKIALQTGLTEILTVASRIGIESPMQPFPSLALGAFEVTPMEMATVYSSLANGGIRIKPIAIKAVVDQDGIPIEKRSFELKRVVSEQATYIVTSILEGVLDRGTGKSARAMGFKAVAAGKTGTTSDYRDSWFAGYDSELMALVWIGFDDNTTTKLTGAQGALPIWTAFMKEARPDTGIPFPTPKGIIKVQIDPTSGALATTNCPTTMEEVFLEGTEPTDYCPLHPNGKKTKGFLERLFQ